MCGRGGARVTTPDVSILRKANAIWLLEIILVSPAKEIVRFIKEAHGKVGLQTASRSQNGYIRLNAVPLKAHRSVCRFGVISKSFCIFLDLFFGYD